MHNTPLHENTQLRVTTETCVIFKDDILIQKRSADSGFFPNYLSLPGGHVDQGEDILSSAIREVREESGIMLKPEQMKLQVSAVNKHIDKGVTWLVFGFKAELDLYQKPKSTDEGEIIWMNKQEVLSSELIFPPISYYLPKIINSNKLLYVSAEVEGGYIKKIVSELEI